MFKYALFLVVALCAVQGFEARTVHHDERGIEDVINTIRDVIKEIRDDLKNAANQIPDLIKLILDKINAVIENSNLSGLIERFKEEIEQIIASGDVAKKCVEGSRQQIEDMIESARLGVDICTAVAKSESAAVEHELEELQAKAFELEEGIYARVNRCQLDHPPISIEFLTCLKATLGPINADVAKMWQEMQDAVARVQEIATEIGNNLAGCVETVRDDTGSKTREIITIINLCIDLSA